MKIGRTLTITKRAQWRAWLRKHHATSREIWLVFHKKNSGKSRLSYNDAVEEALCFGWIDSIIKGIDERKFAQRFTPRKPGSPSSAMNKERAKRLIRARRMTRAGLDAYRRGNRTPVRAGEVLPIDILQAIRSDPHRMDRRRAETAARLPTTSRLLSEDDTGRETIRHGAVTHRAPAKPFRCMVPQLRTPLTK